MYTFVQMMYTHGMRNSMLNSKLTLNSSKFLYLWYFINVNQLSVQTVGFEINNFNNAAVKHTNSYF